MRAPVASSSEERVLRMDDYSLENYAYILPDELIAQTPPQKRGESRLMIIQRGSPAAPVHARFSELKQYLPEGTLLIANNSRVVPARLIGHRPGGGKAEFLLLTPLPLISQGDRRGVVEGLIRPAAKIKPGDALDFGPIKASIIEKSDFGKCIAELLWQEDLEKALLSAGLLPLPPYIRRCPTNSDIERYQTIYAKHAGSVAAPTAGLHFTPEIRDTLIESGMEWREISLHVGYGTFSPVREIDIRNHQMHPEYVVISNETADAIARAKKAGRPVIAVGTTSARALEGVFRKMGKVGPYGGMINIFLFPGQAFNVIDGLLTNFHLPKSSLLMLVSAFAGRSATLAAYAEAISAGYRFFSYGDAMLIRPSH